MAKENPRTPVSSLTFRLGVLGAMQEAEWAARLAPLELKPKHVALLSALRLGTPGSQLELAATLRIAPSLVVLLADQLEQLGAVERVRDPADRRRQHVLLTDNGVRLLDQCVELSGAQDTVLADALTPAERASLDRILTKLAAARGLPT